MSPAGSSQCLVNVLGRAAVVQWRGGVSWPWPLRRCYAADRSSPVARGAGWSGCSLGYANPVEGSLRLDGGNIPRRALHVEFSKFLLGSQTNLLTNKFKSCSGPPYNISNKNITHLKWLLIHQTVEGFLVLTDKLWPYWAALSCQLCVFLYLAWEPHINVQVFVFRVIAPRSGGVLKCCYQLSDLSFSPLSTLGTQSAGEHSASLYLEWIKY